MTRFTKDKNGNWRVHFTTQHGKWGMCNYHLNGFQALIAERFHRQKNRKTQIRGPFKNQKFQVWAYLTKHKERIRFASAGECIKNGFVPGPGNK